MKFPNDIFLDPGLQRDFEQNGYVVVDLLDADDVDYLESCYYQRDQLPDDNGFYATMFHPQRAVKEEICRVISDRIFQRASKYVRGYRPLFGNFIAKSGGNRHEVGIHQDWTYVDETIHRSFNIWTSLCESNEENGGLFVLPGSHLIRMPIRWTPFDNKLYDTYRQEIMDASIGLHLQPGQALIYDSALIHYSSHNNTDQLRLACGCVFVPENVDALHYFRVGNQLEVYRADTAFFNSIIPGSKPDSSPQKTIEIDHAVDLDAFKALFNP